MPETHDLIVVSEFLRQYESKPTRKNYSSILKNYLSTFYPQLKQIKRREEHTQLLDDLSAQYLNQTRNYRNDLLDYRDTITHQAPKTRITKFTVIFRFFEDNEKKFTKRFSRNLIGKETEAISEEFISKTTDIKRLIEHLPIQAKTITMVLSSSGMRPGEALKLKIKNLELTYDPPKIKLPAKITKTRKKRITFISQETKEILLEWLGYRDEYMRRAATRGSLRYNPKDQRVFPFTYGNLASIWKTAVIKAGYTDTTVNNRMCFRMHNLRKFFRTRGNWTNPDVPAALMGHQASLNAIYARMDQAIELLIEGYKEAEPNLSIYQNTKTITELKEKVDKQSEDIEQLVTNLSLRNARLENEIHGMKQQWARAHRYLFEGYSVKETTRALKNGLYLTPIEFLHATIAE